MWCNSGKYSYSLQSKCNKTAVFVVQYEGVEAKEANAYAFDCYSYIALSWKRYASIFGPQSTT